MYKTGNRDTQNIHFVSVGSYSIRTGEYPACTISLYYSMAASSPLLALKKEPILPASAAGLLYLQDRLPCADLYIKTMF